MMLFLAGCGVGIFAGYLLWLVIPIHMFMIACLVPAVLVVLSLLLFHLGVQDFQGY